MMKSECNLQIWTIPHVYLIHWCCSSKDSHKISLFHEYLVKQRFDDIGNNILFQSVHCNHIDDKPSHEEFHHIIGYISSHIGSFLCVHHANLFCRRVNSFRPSFRCGLSTYHYGLLLLFHLLNNSLWLSSPTN